MSDARAATDAGLRDAIAQWWLSGDGKPADEHIGRLFCIFAENGWQVVPKEPTVAMERSAAGRDTRDEGIASMYSGIYRAMLAAAPRP